MAATQPQAPFYVPRPAETQSWTPTSENLDSNILAILTAQKIHAVGGQVQQKFWRYDHVPMPDWQVTAETLNSEIINILTARKIYGAGGQTPTKQWHYDFHVEAPLWLGQPVDSNQLNILYSQVTFFGAAGQAPTKFWRYDYVPPPDWQITAENMDAEALTLPTVTPFYRQWHYDFVPPPDWQITAEAMNSEPLAMLTARAVYGAGGQAPTKQWHYDFHIEAPLWLGTPVWNNTLAELVEGGEPFSRLWRWEVVPAPDWPAQPLPQPNILSFLTKQKIYGAGGEVPTKFWRWDLLPPPDWPATPLASDAISILTAKKIYGQGGQAPTKFWRYDLVPTPDWQPAAESLNSETLYLPSAKPFSKLWRYDYHIEAPVWLWAAPRSDTLAIIKLSPLPTGAGRQWSFGFGYLIEQPLWLWTAPGSSTMAAIELSALPVGAGRQWSFGFGFMIEQPVWAGAPTANLGVLTPAPVTATVDEYIIIEGRRRGRR